MNVAALAHPSVEQQLRDRVSELEEALRQAQEVLAPPAFFPREWKLRPSEERTLSAFMNSNNGFLRNEQIFRASSLYADMGDGYDCLNLVKVRISNLRKKVAPFGVEILTCRGRGYEIIEPSRGIIKAALELRASA